MSEANKAGINKSLPVPYEDDGTDYWQGHLDSWVQSGLSQAAYCRGHDLDYGRFRKWKERLRKIKGTGKEKRRAPSHHSNCEAKF